ncbi:MAG: 4-(cytidine 5'-diphospho)-2-C-methyl-D-erythritol kinase [Bacteroidetes bacterium]|nr:4-(cytidine 5'-diphospho)-2-C-methyl-D-erythritol kinase [Bacteroidota bacterium]
MIVFPNAKINLGLYIENKRGDGYHDIKTIFYPIQLCDALEITKSEDSEFEMTISGIPIIGELDKNLCAKAYFLLKDEFQLPGIKLHLHKAIPHGAGLGGGSADAAFTIKLLNNIFNLSLTDAVMAKYASKIGSDCAFFIENKTVLASGRGDTFENIDISLNDYYIYIVKPDVNVSTVDAYHNVKARNSSIDIRSIINQPIETWKHSLINDFEESIFLNHPELSLIKNSLYANGAIYAALSGSGSALFGIFNKIPSIPFNFPNHYFCWGK